MIRNFSLDEYILSDTAKRLGIVNQLPDALENYAMDTLQMLQYIRDHLSAMKGCDVPMTITSGYRCAKLNAAVGGEPTSDHVAARACDFRAPVYGSPLEIAKELSKYVDELHIGQLINEHPERGDLGWIHVSTRRPVKSINRVITITDHGTYPGIQSA